MSVPVGYIVEGSEDGEVVILSGSLSSDMRMWEPQVEPLVRNGFRAVRYDHRGHGSSPVPAGPYSIADFGEDLIALLDTLGVARAHVVGLSLGGMTAMWVAANIPDRVGSLVLCCTSANMGPPEGWVVRANTVRAGGTEAIADGLLGRWVTPGYGRANPERLAFLRQMITDTPDEGYVAACGAIEKMDLLADLPRITAPTLVVVGAQDPGATIEHGRRIAEGIPGARLEVVEDAAHLGNVERPDQFSRLILDHLKAGS